jgi:transcription antitermination factor NusB
VRIQTSARELALKALYQHDLLARRPLEELRAFCHGNADPEVAELAMTLVAGCIEKRPALDEVISRTAENWELERMATSDRNILRIGVYELLFRPETPPKVAINEAIEMAKKYSTENSPTFVNGVLDRIYTTQRDEGRAVESEPETEPDPQADPGAAGPAPANAPDPEGRVDLHVHSTASDGSLDPEKLPALVAKAGLVGFALTDHDSVEGIGPAREAAGEAGVELIPGVELTGYAPAPSGDAETEVHIAGVFVDPESPPLLERLRGFRQERVRRVRAMCEKLDELGLPVDAEAVMARADGGAVGRVHLGQEMVARGHCRNLRDAFDRFIGTGGPAYVPKEKLTPQQAIELVHRAGGCAVLCHPAVQGIGDDYVAELAGQGLDAVEVHYPHHTPRDEKRLLDLAERLGLLVTGGSDFHGEAKPDIHVGQEAVSLVELEALRQRAVARA